MNIVFLIGNGFDLKQGLKTSYKDFYEWLKVQTDDDPKEKAWIRFKNEIDPNHELWADLEVALGEYLAKVLTENDAIEIINRLREKLQEYICLQNREFNIEDDARISHADLYNPLRFFPAGTQSKIKSFIKDFEYIYVSVNIILFNYTTSLERLIDWDATGLRDSVKTPSGNMVVKDIDAIEHVHGFCDDRGRLAVGVDNKNQINNPILAESQKICRRYVKDDFNNCYELDHALKCANWINSANVICIYGMSLGDSDQRWWKQIAWRLATQSNTLLFYFVHRDMELRGNNGPEYQEQVDEDRLYLMERLGIKDDDSIAHRIFISYSPDIFTPDTPFF